MFIVLACSTAKDSNNLDIQSNSPKIIFFKLKIKCDSLNKKKTIVLINKKITDGKLKEDFDKNVKLIPEYILCSFLDKDMTLLKRTLIENPLKSFFEYEDENKNLKNLKVEKPEADFLIRTKYDENVKYILFEYVINTNNLEKISLINLEN